jgi:hypothetical protein
LPEESDNRFNGDMFTVSAILRASIFYGYIADSITEDQEAGNDDITNF